MTAVLHSKSTAQRAGWPFLLCALGLVLAAPAHVATAAVCRVTSGGSAAGSGTWTSPMDLQSALANTACNEIWVAAGTYKPTPGTDRSISFGIRPGVAVYGGFAGGESARAQRDPQGHVATLSGDIGTSADSSDNSYHVVALDGSTAAGNIDNTTVLDGFTIRDGNADGSLPGQAAGGGLYCFGANAGGKCSPTLSQLVFRSNHAVSNGGALYNAGYANGDSSPALQNVTFTDNSAAYGGAVNNDGSNGTSSPNFDKVTFSGNTAIVSGGAMFNSANSVGTSSPVLVNSTFSDNSADFGGAIYNASTGGFSRPVLNNVTFSGNSAITFGGAMYSGVDSAGTASPVLSNVILWADTAGSSAPEIGGSAGASVNIDHSVVAGGCAAISGASCGSGNTGADPKLGALADNGGFAQTMLPGAGSSAIDAGSAATCANAWVDNVDQRGATRPQGNGCDIGAVEVGIVHDLIFTDGFETL